MIQIVRTEREVETDESDLIAVAEASRISGRTISAIVGMMEAGSLPWYQLAFGYEQRKRVPKFTSRKAVESLGEKRVIRTARKRTK